MATMATSAGRTDRQGGNPDGCRHLVFTVLAVGALCGGCASVFHPIDGPQHGGASTGRPTLLAAVNPGTVRDAATEAPAELDEAERAERRQNRALGLMREYAQACTVADARGHLDLAERACRWSLTAAEAAPADPMLISHAQFQLGQIMRRQGQFRRAETHFQAALAIELEQPVVSQRRVATRLIELAAVQAGQRRWQRGRRTLERALPYSTHLSGSQRAYAAEVYSRYSAHLRVQPGGNSQARRFEARALALR